MVPAAIICGLLMCFSSAPSDGYMQSDRTHVSPLTVDLNRDTSRYIIPMVAPLVKQRPGNPFVSSEGALAVEGRLNTSTSRKMSTTVVTGPRFWILSAKRPKRSA